MEGAEMRMGRRWRGRQLIAIALTLALVTAGLVSTLPAPGGSVAFASVANSDKNERDKEKDAKKDKGRDGDEDHVARGQVIDINNLIDPPELTLAAVDGAMLVRVLKTDEIALNGVKLWDYITIQGEKIHEQLFEATQISVDDHHC